MVRSFPPLCAAVACAGILGGAAPGCKSAGPRPFEIRAHVTSDGAIPVPGALVRVRGVPLGTTDAFGRATLRIQGDEGERVPVALTCPEAFRATAGPSPLALTGGSEPDSAAPLTLELTCPLDLREAVVLVHAAGAASQLPVKVDGVVVGQTDALGFAHVHVRAAPDSEFEVSLDTTAHERLSPVNPTRRYRLQRSDELFVLDTSFLEPRPSARKRRAAQRRPSATPTTGK
jgi:hypothetical protein